MYKYIDRVKVLPVHPYMKQMHKIPFLRETAPRIDRNGYYLVRGSKAKEYISWFEWEGRAWYTDPGYFLYELALLDVKQLNADQVSAIEYVLNIGAMSAAVDKKLRTILYINQVVRDSRKTKHQFMKTRLTIQRRFNEQ